MSGTAAQLCVQSTFRHIPLLLKKLDFISKHAATVSVSPFCLSAENIQIQLPEFCSVRMAMRVDDLIELLQNGATFTRHGDTLVYSYTVSGATVTRHIPLFDPDPELELPNPLISVKVDKVELYTKDDIEMSVEHDMLLLSSSGHIKTSINHPIEIISGSGPVRCRVAAGQLAVLRELEGDLAISFFESCAVAYGFETECTTAVVIRGLDAPV